MIIILDEAAEMTEEELDECVKFVEEVKQSHHLKMGAFKNGRKNMQKM